MRSRMYKNKYSLILLIILFAGITLGYAYLSTTVNFNGTAVINNAEWNIYLDETTLHVTDGRVEATEPATINVDKTSVTYEVTLTNPGDFYEFTVDVKNDGSIDGMIDTISSKLNDEEITNLPSYLEYSASYSSGAKIQKKQLLKATKKETIKIRIEFKKDITASDLPKTAQTLNLNFSVGYVQADENGVEVAHPITRYTVNIIDYEDEPNTAVYINQPISENIVQYETADDARANFSNNPYYLKHKIEGGIVKESYLEFVVTEEMAAANEGMTAGTYTLKGADTAAYYANKATLKEAFGKSHCEDYFLTISCSVSGLTARAGDNGVVDALDGSRYCGVDGGGDSYCGEME